MAISLLNVDARIEVKDSELANVLGGDPDVVYVLRQIMPAVRRRLERKVPNRRTGQMETDYDATLDAVIDHVLIEWRGVLLNGAAAPCTTENKALLDVARKIALSNLAAANRSTEDKQDSFREPASLL